MAFETEALVARGPFSEGQWAMEPVTLRPLGPDEVLVEMVASGICHTDLHCGNTAADAGVPSVFYPRVLGHEGGFLVSCFLFLLSFFSLSLPPLTKQAPDTWSRPAAP